jgi:hypothetical protein
MSKSQKKTVTKSTNLLGDNYWNNAAKQIVWPVDLIQRHISVPESELQQAKDNLMVQHFCNNGWHIQSCIDVIKNKPFIAPVSTGPIFKPVKVVEVKESLYHLEDKFKVISTGEEFKIVFMDKGKLHLKYLNRDKPNIISSEENLSAMLNRKLWEIVL